MTTGIVIVKQYERMVVLRFGQWNGEITQPGFRFLVPIIYSGAIVDTREQVERVPTQKYITSDNVVVDMDFVIYYQVLENEAARALLEVENYRLAVINLAVATLRAVIGSTSLAEALSQREREKPERAESPAC